MVTLDNIGDYTFGAVRIWEDNGYFRFSRFTEKQDKVLKKRGNAEQIILATAGIRIEFMTYGGKLSFSFKGVEKKYDNDYFSFEIVENGTPVYHYFEKEPPENGEVEYVFQKSEEKKHIAIYFSNLISVRIKDLILPEGSLPIKKKYNHLAFGDSITQGVYGKHSNHTYINIFADNIDANLLNQGVAGEGFCTQFIDENLDFEPDIITIALGANNYLGGNLFGNEINNFFDKINLLYKGKKVFVLLPIWLQNGSKSINGKTLQDCRDYIGETANNYSNMTVIDCKDFVPHLSDFYADNPNAHPNDLGQIYYGKRLTETVTKFL